MFKRVPIMTNAELDPLRKGWILKECKDYPGKAYYYNEELNFSTWIRPPKDEKFIYLQQICLKSAKSINPKDSSGNEITRTEAEAKELIRDIHSKLQMDSNMFSYFAEQYSDIYTKETCGTLGWVKIEDFYPKMANEIKKLQPGSISQIIYNQIGSFIFKRLA